MNENRFDRILLTSRCGRLVEHLGNDPAHRLHIDFDYLEWGRWRVARAEAVIADSDYQKWLDLQ